MLPRPAAAVTTAGPSGAVTAAAHTARVTLLAPGTDDLLAALRGTPALRPAVDRGQAGGLRALLEDGLFERLGGAGSPVRITTATIAGAAPVASSTAPIRGALVAQLVRLRLAGVAVADAFDDASCALAASGRDEHLVALICDLDADEHARLGAEVMAHDAVLRRRLGAIPARWTPRCGLRQVISLAGGRVELRGFVDAALGAPGSPRASVCLLEVTTSSLEPRHDDVLSYLALLETLRTGEAPLRAAALSTGDDRFVVRDATPELLFGAAMSLLDLIERRERPS